ncbi:hypothetical protein [Microvirga massiliensis]|uniref:hypothetical protein n=1 Tax=Microvirga massiliensis TaxID=1033741 RepID=UPI000AFFCB7D|nr:hypothetical protein [Microvirga massiliensis]
MGAAIAGLVAMAAQVRIEERVMREIYGCAYADYAAQVPRWLGRVRKQHPSEED